MRYFLLTNVPETMFLTGLSARAHPARRAALAQLVRALDCGSRGRPFNPGRRYHHNPKTCKNPKIDKGLRLIRPPWRKLVSSRPLLAGPK